MLTDAGLRSFYGPFLFWLCHLPPKIIAHSLTDLWEQRKAPYINNLLKLSVLIGEGAVKWLTNKMRATYSGMTQPPEFFFAYEKTRQSNAKLPLLRALRANNAKKLDIPGSKQNSYQFLIENPSICINHLSKLCYGVFEGNVTHRSIVRELDYLSYWELLHSKASEIEEHLLKSG
jgi:hypothetical protein